MWLNLKTEFSFRAVYGHLQDVADRSTELGSFAGIADLNNTFGHVRWKKACANVGIKPIYGVRLAVSEEPNKARRYPYNIMTFIAMNQTGLQEIYHLIDLAHQQFYYRPRISYKQLNAVSDNVILLSGVAPDFNQITREFFLELSPALPRAMRKIKLVPSIAAVDNWYIYKNDVQIYEPLADERQRERKTTPQWVLTPEEWLQEFPGKEDALYKLYEIGEKCNVELKKAPMVSFPGKTDIESVCRLGAKAKGIDLSKKVYKKRFKRELKLIKEKEYVDYFFVVADLIKDAKTKMVVGPGRGSSAGSLICYLMDITDVDPIKYGLYFERFIDINRFDLPDIDIDFADDKRHLVINYLNKKYGENNVAQIGNVSRLKPKSAIIKFAKALHIPEWDIKEIKDGIIDRPPGDKRANFCIKDTFNQTEIGKAFVANYPNMKTVGEVENHASHSSVHAAGILVCNDPITNYCGINSREKRIAMIDMKDAVTLNLLKIDALGLRTLSMLASVCKQIRKPFEWLSSIPLDDKKTYKIFKKKRFTGIFQFEGEAMRKYAPKTIIENIEDIAALVSIVRPGPMSSGGANSYIKTRRGDRKIKYLSNHKSFVSATKATMGVLIYQEQVLQICREYGLLSWEDTGILRKALSKSKGEEFFSTYLEKFIVGAKKNSRPEKEAREIWDHIKTFGGYGFNKAHAISYSLISYMCAYCKAHYPLEFAVATLNHAKDDPTTLKLLRDIYENDGINYVPFDREISQPKWTYYKGKLYGGLLTINGIGPAAANKILKAREGKITLPMGISNRLDECDTPFKSIYPAREIYGKFYKKWKKYTDKPPVEIDSIKDEGQYFFIGQLRKKSLRDANEAGKVEQREGEYLEGQTTYLNLIIEDDTGSMPCMISRFEYDEYGHEIAEEGKENKDWYLVAGHYKEDHERCYIREIRRITQ